MPANLDLMPWLQSIGAEHVVEALGQLLPDAAIFGVNANREVTWWSPGAEKMLGTRAADVVGTSCRAAQRCHNCMAGCGIADHGQVRNVPLVVLGALGKAIAVRKTGIAFVSPTGQFAGGVEVLLPDPNGPPPETILPGEAVTFHGLVAHSAEMQAVFELVKRVAPGDTTVLIRGESGTGKEGIARAIHQESGRKGRFVAVNCAALAAGLVDSELFGHVRGAFTGALRDHTGFFKDADGGTLFLDEVAELPLETQAKLLRVLQERVVTPVGSTRPVTVDVRIVAATHRSLREQVARGAFREDLLYRLRVVPVRVPPLRERPGDLPVLIWHLIERKNAQGRRLIRQIDSAAMRRLLAWPWPGNVRELQNAMEYIFAVGRGTLLRVEDLPAEIAGTEAPHTWSAATAIPQAVSEPGPTGDLSPEERTQAQQLRDALTAHRGHVGKAADALGMSRPTFWRHRKRLGV